jgi:hypothetical protein
LRSSGTFDNILELSRQFAPILFTQGREAKPFAVAGTNGESQKESQP